MRQLKVISTWMEFTVQTTYNMGQRLGENVPHRLLSVRRVRIEDWSVDLGIVRFSGLSKEIAIKLSGVILDISGMIFFSKVIVIFWLHEVFRAGMLTHFETQLESTMRDDLYRFKGNCSRSCNIYLILIILLEILLMRGNCHF